MAEDDVPSYVQWQQLLLIAVLLVAGVLLRFCVNAVVINILHTHNFLGTSCINLLGAFLIGVVYVLGPRRGVISLDVAVGVMTGLLGGFTTFSGMLHDAVVEAHNGKRRGVVAAVVQPLLGLGASAAGVAIATAALA